MKRLHTAVAACLLVLAFSAVSARREKSPEEERASIDQMKADTLRELYGIRPEAKELLQRCLGFAVFSTKGVKVLVAGGTHGRGVIVDQADGHKTYMKMAQVNVGLGYGLQDARLVFIFESRRAMEEFATQGWDFSGKANAEASAGSVGGGKAGAVSFMPGVLVYQFTERGLAASITLGGTKFWADEKLNP